MTAGTASRWWDDQGRRARAALLDAERSGPLDGALVHPGHDHEWDYTPPATVGATGVWRCSTCGLYDTTRPAPDGIL